VRGSDLLLGPFGRVMAANFAFFMNFASFFLLPLFVKELGGRESTVGWVMGSAGVATLASLPLVGMRIDRLSRRRLFLFGAANMTLAACAFAWVDEIGWPLFALRLWQGVSFAAAFTASTTLAAELAPVAVRGRALGWFGVSTLLTHALAPALGEEVLHRWGFSTLFFLAAACSLIALVLIRGVPERRPVAVAASGQGSLQRIHFLLGLAVVFFGMGFGVVTTYAASFVQSQQLGRVGVFFSAYTAMAIAVRIVAGGLSDRFGRLAVAVPALIALGVSVAGLATVHSSSGLLVAGALFGLAQGIAYPTMHAFLVDVTSAAVLGRAQALFNGAFNFGVMSAALAFGPVADRFGPRVMFAVAAFCPWFAAALFPAASRARKPGGPS
jgi:MFS family permease